MILVFLVAARIRHPNVCNICSSEKIINISIKILSFIHYILWHNVQFFIITVNAHLIRSSRKKKLYKSVTKIERFLYIYRKTLQYGYGTVTHLATATDIDKFCTFLYCWRKAKTKVKSTGIRREAGTSVHLWLTMVSPHWMIFINSELKRTVSRDGFRFCWHVWDRVSSRPTGK